MLKKQVTYEDYNGDQVTETLYFNLSKPELLDLEVEFDGGLARFMQKIIEAQDVKQLIAQFKKIVLLSYGQKSDDGKRFIKNDQLREEFEQSAAYSEVFMELATDDKAGIVFLTGVLPKDMADAALEEQKKLDAAAAAQKTEDTTPSV